MLLVRGEYRRVEDPTRLFLVESLPVIGAAVAGAWLALALAGVWRPEPGWIDRSGRLVGLALITADMLKLVVILLMAR